MLPAKAVCVVISLRTVRDSTNVREANIMLAEIIGGGHTSKHQIQQGEIRASITSRNVGTSEDHQAS